MDTSGDDNWRPLCHGMNMERSPTNTGCIKYNEWAKRVSDEYKKIEESLVAQGDYCGAMYWRDKRKEHEAEVKAANDCLCLSADT